MLLSLGREPAGDYILRVQESLCKDMSLQQFVDVCCTVLLLTRASMFAGATHDGVDLHGSAFSVEVELWYRCMTVISRMYVLFLFVLHTLSLIKIHAYFVPIFHLHMCINHDGFGHYDKQYFVDIRTLQPRMRCEHTYPQSPVCMLQHCARAEHACVCTGTCMRV